MTNATKHLSSTTSQPDSSTTNEPQRVLDRLRAHGIQSDLRDYRQVETAIAEALSRAYLAGFHDARTVRE